MVLAFALSVATACGMPRDDQTRDSESHAARPDSPLDATAEAEIPAEFDDPDPILADPQPAALDSQADQDLAAVEPGPGPFPVGGDIEPPRRLTDSLPIEDLNVMMQSGEYAWGACIFRLAISETGEVGEIEFLKPEDLAPEVQKVIAQAVQGWEFSPATRAGQPVPVYYSLVIHHCPYRKSPTDSG